MTDGWKNTSTAGAWSLLAAKQWTTKSDYDKCSKILNTISFYSQIKCLFSGLESKKMLVRIASKEDHMGESFQDYS